MKNDDDNYYELKKLCQNNYNYFKNDKTEKGLCFQNIFQEWIDNIQTVKWKTEKVEDFAHEYDFDKENPGNGYRSFITIVNSAINHGKNICEKLISSRNKYLFRKNFYLKEITACKELFASLSTCLEYLLILHEWSDNGSLFINDDHTTEELFEMSEKINQYCFYGRCACFQYAESMKHIIRGLSICMASYSESYFSKNNKIIKMTSSAWTSSKYFLNPELRAKRIVNISHSANISFCKSFWFLAENEIMHTLPSIFGSSVEVNKVIKIPLESIQMENVETGELVCIPIPKSHLPPNPVSVRLLSSKKREGMIGVLANNKLCAPKSKKLIIHCHGGGFVAQSSKSHELYLRDWAVSIDCPILSVDYSLAPEAPYPRALEEVFYVYCWALKNASLLGTTAEKVVLAGDSAGANLCLATTFKCIDFGLRKPDGVFMAYCPVYIDFIPSPARMLCLMDSLLPFGFLIRCMKAYAGVDENGVEAVEVTNKSKSNSKNDLKSKNSVNSSIINSDEEKSYSKNGNIESDEGSDTFASASIHSQVLENTELLTPDIPSSCISFEDDSQPIMKLSEETLNNISTSLKDSKLNNTAVLKEFDENTLVKTPSEENIILEVGKDVLSPKSIQNRLYKAATCFVEKVSTTLKSLTDSSEIRSEYTFENEEYLKNIDVLIARNPYSDLCFKVTKNIYISPYIAPDEYLKQMPPINILTIDLDPCLDDGVMFAKRLKKVGVPVKLDILKGLCHGFLNFTMLSKEANEGSKKCSNRIEELLNNELKD